MEWLIAISVLAVMMAMLGAWIAAQKRRDTSEGVILGLLFGPLGVLIEALLPNGATQSGSISGRSQQSLNDAEVVAYIADRYRTHLDETNPYWRDFSPHRKRSVLKPLDKHLQAELKLSPTQFSNYAAAARQSLFGSRQIS